MSWFVERLHKHTSQQLAIDEVLHEGRTDFQDLLVFRNGTFGRVMALDGTVQVTEADEFAYHEMMSHVPLFAHGAAKNVLIIGGGDGGLLREVLRHDVRRVTEVELDAGVVEATKRHMPFICGDAYEDARTDLVIGDGAKYVAETDARFDVILVDSTDPIGPGEILFSHGFYADCRKCLNPGGVLVTQNGVPFMQGDELRQSVAHFRDLFADAACYLVSVPTYVNGQMALGWASLDPALRNVDVETLRSRYEKSGITTRYYNPDVHRAAFALPNFVRDLLR